MTRINAGIPPVDLTDRHLLAEHREIKRIPNAISNNKFSLNGQPKLFTLGKGHVKFFYDKLKYLHNRYMAIHSECVRRKFNVQNFGKSFLAAAECRPDLYNDWAPTETARRLIQQRIHERLNK